MARTHACAGMAQLPASGAYEMPNANQPNLYDARGGSSNHGGATGTVGSTVPRPPPRSTARTTDTLPQLPAQVTLT